MRRAQKRALFWQGVGVLCYLVGLVLCVFTAVGIYLASPAGSFGNATAGDFVLLLGGMALIVTGRVVTYTRGRSPEMVGEGVGIIREQPPEKSTLEELGYHIPPEGTGRPESGLAYEDGEVRAVCPECGERNDSDFEFCRRCSSELPE